jgi:hypothetical protein
VLAVEDSLQKGDFTRAAAQLQLLPKVNVNLNWDDHKVPQGFRAAFRKAGDDAMSLWRGRIPGLTFSNGSKPDIRISFEPVLAKRPDTDLPAAHVSFWSEEPNSPRLDYVIGLKRGSPLKGSEEIDVFDDVAYCIGSYLGLGDGVIGSDTMAPTDLPRVARTSISGIEFATMKKNLQVVAILERAVKEQITITPTKADLFIDPMVLDSEPVIQGDRVEFHVQLSNRGNGPLTFSMFPDCGCTVVTEPGTVDPGSARMVSFAVDTTNFISNVSKHVAIYTNDPTNPVRVVTLNIKIRPRYRLLTPLGDTVVVPPTGLKYALYLIPALGTNLDPVSVTLSGTVPGKISYSPWQGVLPDPELNEGPKQRKGFKVQVDISGSVGSGRNQATIQILTANSEFPDIAYSFNTQKGIIALPDQVVMGEVGKVPKGAQFIVTRPKSPFKILGVLSNSPNLKASVVPGRSPDTYSIAIQYDGNARSGELLASVKVKTDDPKQPVIDVPVSATVR